MGKKYKVCCDGHFMGHYHDASAKAAVEKAIREHWLFKPEIYLDKTAVFTAQKYTTDFFSWEDFPKLFPHIDTDCQKGEK